MAGTVPPAIGTHRLLGGGRSTALVRPDGEIDWWCAPEPDSPPLLWSLLDPEGPGARWLGTRLESFDDRPAGPTVTTQVVLDGGRVECRDALGSWEDGTVLVRLVRRVAGTGDTVQHELRLGGFDRSPVAWTGTTARLGDLDVRVLGGTCAVVDGTVTTTLALSGDWDGMAVVVGEPAGVDLEDLPALVARIAEEGSRARRLALPRRHRDRAEDALAVLDACTHPSGGTIASPTTSLPEVPGGDRQFDYRFTWLRDASLAAAVAAQLGDGYAAERHLAFLQCSDDLLAAPVFDPRGDPVPDEREVAGVEGWAGSRPVRVGNGAKDQVQHDALGFVVDAVFVCVRSGGSLTAELRAVVGRLADRAVEDGDPTNGIWELREAAPLLSADIGRWLTLDRAIRLAPRRLPWTAPRSWRRARRQVRRQVLGAVRPDGSLPQRHDRPDGGGDASALLLVITGLLRPRSSRARRLVDATLDELRVGPFLHRYEPDGRDGFDPGEGAFVPTSWWAVSALAASGRVQAASDLADELCGALPRLLPEEWDVGQQRALGNTPLVWSHAECARALHLLDEAAVRRRTGPAGVRAWRVARRRVTRRR